MIISRLKMLSLTGNFPNFAQMAWGLGTIAGVTTAVHWCIETDKGPVLRSPLPSKSIIDHEMREYMVNIATDMTSYWP